MNLPILGKQQTSQRHHSNLSLRSGPEAFSTSGTAYGFAVLGLTWPRPPALCQALS